MTSAFTGLELLPIPPGRVLLSDRRLQRRWQVDVPAFRLAAVPVTMGLLHGGESPAPKRHSRPAPPGRAADVPAVVASADGAGVPPGRAEGVPGVVARADGAGVPGVRAEGVSAVVARAAPGCAEGRPGLVDRAAAAAAAAAGPADGTPAEGARAGLLPAVNVSWWDAVRFCNALSEREGLTPPYLLDGESVTWDETADGYRLPTEAEWEHACRAGTTAPRYGELDEIAWYRGNSEGRLREPGGKLPNAWGLHDMLGNTWDWCWDVYDAEVYGSYRVLRGGGWFDEHWSCRASVRRRSHPAFTVDDVSFRLARSL